jgi:hypothetical protein
MTDGEGHTVEIPGVPQTITRAQYTSLLEALGLEIKDLRHLEFRYDGIYAEVFARTPEGHLRVDRQKDEVVLHKVFIPVTD